MRELFLQPEVQSYETFAEFAEAFKRGKGDLLVTNEPVLPSFQADLPADVYVLCTEKYGVGEPSDVMFDAIQEDLKTVEYTRVVAVGGSQCADADCTECTAESYQLQCGLDGLCVWLRASGNRCIWDRGRAVQQIFAGNE